MDKLRAIQYFMKVAEAKSLVGAAHALDVSPSAVSKVITAFESTLGFALFHRSTRRLSLTSNGASYLDYCRHALRGSRKRVKSTCRQQDSAASGTVKIGMHPAFRFAFVR